MQTIFGLIRSEIDDFVNNYIEVVPGYTFSQYQTIKRIHLYTNSHYEDDSKYHGRKKIFFNIVNYRRDTVMKSLDIDTKDVKVIPLNEQSKFDTFLMQKEFELWLKENNIGQLFNDSVEQLATFGSTVVKTTSEMPELVDLRRFFLDPTVDTVKQSRFVIQEHYMTQIELNKMKGKWDDDAIKTTIDRFGSVYSPSSYTNGGQINIEGTTPYYKIYERYGEVPKYMLDADAVEDSKELVMAQFIVAEPYATYRPKADSEMTIDNGVVLSKVEWKEEIPFDDCHFSKTKGRWLGVGPIEVLFPAQERFNEMANQKRIAMELSSIHLFQTTDRTVPTSLSSYMNSGDVLVTNAPITPIDTTERNLPAFENEQAHYDQLSDRLTFSYDAGRGEALPTSTPATNAVIQNNNVNSYFSLKRENFGLFWGRIFNDKIAPMLMKDLKAEHVLRFLGEPEEIARLDEIVAPHFVRQQLFKEVIVDGKVVDNVRLEQIKQEVSDGLKKGGIERYVDVIKNHYKDTKWKFDFIITNEQEDTAVQAQNMFMVIQQLAQNPNLIDDPVLRTVFYKYCEQIGIQPMQLEVAQHQREQLKQQMQEKEQQLQQMQQLQGIPPQEQTAQRPQLTQPA